MELILCRVVESSCLPTHNIVPHISWHVQPCHKTMKKYEDFEGMEDLLQIRSLETVPVCIVLQYYPHDNIVCIHMCDECKISIDSGFCHRLWSIFSLIVQAYLLTIEYQVVQFLPSKSISEQFESIHVTILLQISILPL